MKFAILIKRCTCDDENFVIMLRWKMALILGFMSWLIPFVLSFMLYPIKAFNSPLYNNILSLIGLATGALLLNVYFKARPVVMRESLALACLWIGMNLMLDQPFFLYGPI